MSGAVVLASTNESGERIRRLWDRIGAFEDMPSMSSLGYRPHITLAVYEEIDARELSEAVHSVFGTARSVRVVFDRIRYFDSSPLVLWASPKDSSRLAELHAVLHGRIDPALCHRHYRPGHWVPHCTLATRVLDEKREEALAFAATPLEPFEVVFDSADCVDFPPVRIIESVDLAGAGTDS